MSFKKFLKISLGIVLLIPLTILFFGCPTLEFFKIIFFIKSKRKLEIAVEIIYLVISLFCPLLVISLSIKKCCSRCCLISYESLKQVLMWLLLLWLIWAFLYTHLTWGEFNDTSFFCSDYQDDEGFDKNSLIACKVRAANLICQWAFLFLAILWARFLHLGYIDESLDIGSRLVDNNYNKFDPDDLNPGGEHGDTNFGGKGE
ncbi:hypothetical protein Glove_541g20 [Diversispora epigaea]|uniref:MARVEL domain-containing protein n=1 Tax=Diversispora epigaea TaxID=1348612 RepID=A0A397GHD0_9GLOM|nr:hypothetical protein Glove_541g20 [Diversispora epigaea]